MVCGFPGKALNSELDFSRFSKFFFISTKVVDFLSQYFLINAVLKLFLNFYFLSTQSLHLGC